jgi:hypothetical protein
MRNEREADRRYEAVARGAALLARTLHPHLATDFYVLLTTAYNLKSSVVGRGTGDREKLGPQLLNTAKRLNAELKKFGFRWYVRLQKDVRGFFEVRLERYGKLPSNSGAGFGFFAPPVLFADSSLSTVLLIAFVLAALWLIDRWQQGEPPAIDVEKMPLYELGRINGQASGFTSAQRPSKAVFTGPLYAHFVVWPEDDPAEILDRMAEVAAELSETRREEQAMVVTLAGKMRDDQDWEERIRRKLRKGLLPVVVQRASDDSVVGGKLSLPGALIQAKDVLPRLAQGYRNPAFWAASRTLHFTQDTGGVTLELGAGSEAAGVTGLLDAIRRSAQILTYINRLLVPVRPENLGETKDELLRRFLTAA